METPVIIKINLKHNLIIHFIHGNMQCVVNHKVDLFFSQFTSLSQKQRNLCVNLTNSLTVLELKQRGSISMMIISMMILDVVETQD